MTNPPAAEKFILFQLDQLSAHNEHHRFEELCYRIARRRVTSNVKLASGPVSAGGDQGRDAETFMTWLPEQLPHAQGFVATSSAKPVVVACSVQKDGLPRKVKEDITTICADAPTGEPVEAVLFCCVANIPTAKQHELQEWAHTTHNVKLEIFDGQTLAKLLAEFDLVWIAQEYLELPSHMVPDYPGEEPAPQWYSDLLARYRRSEATTRSLGDLAQLRPGLRHATRDPDARADLPEWLAYMALFLDPDLNASDELTMRARYEIAVGHIRGLNSLTAVEQPIREFIRHAAATSSLSLLDDAQVLLMYYGGALSHDLDPDTRTVTFDELADLHQTLTTATHTMRISTDPTTYPVRYARLLEIEALLALHPAYEGFEALREELVANQTATTEDTGSPTSDTVVPEEDLTDDQETYDLPAGWLSDPEKALTLLGKLVATIPQVPALSVDILAQQFDMLSPILIDLPGYNEVRDGLDEAVAQLQGDSAIADRARTRAITFLKNGRPLDALREFHTAKEKWWHGDTLKGTLLAMRMIARIYESLGMTMAAKQYRCTAASLALTSAEGDSGSLGEMVADSLLETMASAYKQGLWLDAIALGRVTALARNALVANPFDYDEHPDTLKMFDFYVATALHAVHDNWPGLEHVALTALGTTGWETGVLELVEGTKESWATRGEDFLTSTDRELDGTPYSDAGPTRTITFAALGTRWYVKVENEHLAVLAAERFCAATQILLCELADRDPLLVAQDIHVEIRTGKPLGTDERIRIAPNNDGLECTVFLTPYSDGLDRATLDKETFAILARMLFAMSMRPDEDVMKLIDETAKQGLLSKLQIGRSFDEVANLLEPEHYQACRNAQIADRATPYVPHEADELAAPTGPGPGYDPAEALEAVKARYERVSDLYALTIARALQDDRIHGLLQDLRNDGWLDWHLLGAIASIAVNYRANNLGLYNRPQLDREAIAKLMYTKETETSIEVPLDAYTADALKQALQTNALTTAAGLGLTPPTQTPNLNANLDLLRTRYGYVTDDLPHIDLLSPDLLDATGAIRPMLINEEPTNP